MRATITTTPTGTRILVQDATGDRLLARLRPLTCAGSPRALPCLMEALALWCGVKVTRNKPGSGQRLAFCRVEPGRSEGHVGQQRIVGQQAQDASASSVP